MKSLIPNQEYNFYVVALNNGFQGAKSTILKVTTPEQSKYPTFHIFFLEIKDKTEK